MLIITLAHPEQLPYLKILNLIIPAKSLMPCQAACSQALERGRGIPLPTRLKMERKPISGAGLPGTCGGSHMITVKACLSQVFRGWRSKIICDCPQAFVLRGERDFSQGPISLNVEAIVSHSGEGSLTPASPCPPSPHWLLTPTPTPNPNRGTLAGVLPRARSW